MRLSGAAVAGCIFRPVGVRTFLAVSLLALSPFGLAPEAAAHSPPPDGGVVTWDRAVSGDGVPYFGTPPVHGTSWVDGSVITPSDPSACTISAGNPSRKTVSIYRELINAWVFDASCDGGANSFEILVHEDFTEAEAASAAKKYGHAVGRLPKVLRAGVGVATGIRQLWISKGSSAWNAAPWNGRINIQTEFPGNRWYRNIEESLVHEAAHVSLDNRVEPDSGWRAAQREDPAFISGYANDYRTREDVAESFTAYLSARYVPSRIGKSWETTIFRTMPNRIAYFDALLSADDMKPFSRSSPRAAGLVLGDDAIQVKPGAAGTYRIRLLSPPDASVTVTPASSDGTIAKVGGPITFTPKNWHVLQSVKVTGVAAGKASISHAATSSDGDYGIAASKLPDVAVSVNGRDRLRLTVSAGPGDVFEGGTKKITLALNRPLVAGEKVTVPLKVPSGSGLALHAPAKNGWADYLLACESPLPAGVTCPDLNRYLSDSTVNFTFAGPSAKSLELTLSAHAKNRSTASKDVEEVRLEFGDPGGGVDFVNRVPRFNIRGAGLKPVATLSVGAGSPSSERFGRIVVTEGATVTATVSLSKAVSVSPCFRVNPSVGNFDPFLDEASRVKDFTFDNAVTSPSGHVYYGIVCIPAGKTEASTVIRTVDDGEVEDVELLRLGLSSSYFEHSSTYLEYRPPGRKWWNSGDEDGPLDVDGTRVDVIIKDNGRQAPSVSIAAKAASVTEGGDAVFTLTASPAPAADLAVDVTVTEAGGYADAGAHQVTIPKGGTAELVIATTGDETDEPDGSVTATLATGGGYTVASPPGDAATVAVADDDDPAPSVSIAAKAASVTEGGNAVFALTASPAPVADLSVDVTVTEAGGYADAGAHQVTIPKGGTAELVIATKGDETDETDGSVTATLATGDGYTVAPPPGDAASVSVADDDYAVSASAPIAQCASSLPGNALSVPEVAGWRDVRVNRGDAALAARWDRVLAALDPSAGAGAPMEASEAERYAARGQIRWTRTAATLRAIERCLDPPPIAQCASHLPGNAVTVAEVEGWREQRERRGNATLVDRWNRVLAALDPSTGAGEPMAASEAKAHADSGLTTRWKRTAATLRAVERCLDPPPIVQCASHLPGNAVTVAEVAGWRDHRERRGNATLVDRWNRVLAALDPSAGAGEPMAASEAKTHADSGLTTRWKRTAATLGAVEGCLAPEISVAAGSGVTEGVAATFTLTATPAPSVPLTVDVTVTDAAGSDFVAPDDEGGRTVTIPAGETEAGFAVTTVDDEADEPDGSVTVTLVSGDGYSVADAPGDAVAVAVADDDASVALPDGDGSLPVTISFVDKHLEKPEGRGFAYRVSLSAPAPGKLHSYWRIRHGRTSDSDFVGAGWGLLIFKRGEQEKTISIITANDSHDEAREDFTVVLSDSPWRLTHATVADGEATGVIVNSDPLPAAWLARFGRTVAEQALEGIAGRMAAARTPGLAGSFGGQPVGSGSSAARPGHPLAGTEPPAAATLPENGAAGDRDSGTTEAKAEVVHGFDIAGGAHDDHLAAAGAGPGPDDPPASWSRTVSARDLLLASSFSLTGERDANGGSVAFWGLASHGSFDGREDLVELDGEVITAMLGADRSSGNWLLGVAVTQSEGEGTYRETNPDKVRSADGRVDATLTAVIPYASWRASERLGLWGAAGAGAGKVTLTPDSGEAIETGTGWNMAALGMRSEALRAVGEAGGPALSIVSDALWVGTSSERSAGLAASDSDVTRLRFGLEGTWTRTLASGATLAPRFEIGLRHDGGDAETGLGLEIGGGVDWSDPARGLNVRLEGRTLALHEDGDFRDRGLSVTVSYDPRPETARGLSATVSHSLGASSSGGVAALIGPSAFPEASGSDGDGTWSAEVAHGTGLGQGMVGSPYGRVSGSLGTKDDVRLGYRIGPDAAHAADASLDLWAEPATDGGDRNAVGAGFEWRW